MDIISLRDFILIIVVIIGSFISIFIYLKFAPIVQIKIIDSWIDDELLILRIEIENISKVRVAIKQNELQLQNSNILFQKFKHDKGTALTLTEFLPFSKEWFDKKKYPSKWKEPEIIFETTKWIYPSEIIAVERIIQCNKNDIFHIGVQVHASFGLLEFADFRHWSQRWTSVKFIAKKKDT